MPSSFIIDKKGVVRYAHVGYHDGEEVEVEKEIKELWGSRERGSGWCDRVRAEGEAGMSDADGMRLSRRALCGVLVLAASSTCPSLASPSRRIRRAPCAT